MSDDNVVSEMFGEELPITPSDLYSKEFKRALVGGYAPHEVDEMLEKVADVLEALIVQSHVLREQNKEQKNRLAEYSQMESTLHSALASSQKFADNVLDSAKRQAESLIEEARLQRDRATLDAERLPEKIQREIDDLKSQRDRLKSELNAILDMHRNLLDTYGIDETAVTTPVTEVALDDIPDANDTGYPENDVSLDNLDQPFWQEESTE